MATAQMICQNCEKEADWETFCVQCEQLYCNDCTKYHRGVKATRKHILVDVSHRETDLTNSDLDADCGNEYCEEHAVGLCIDCEQVFCNNCTNQHYVLKATKDHTIIAAKVIEPPGDTQSRTTRTSGDHSYIHDSRTNLSVAQVQVSKGIYEGVCEHDFVASAPGEKDCPRIRGIAIISDGKTWRIIVADYKNQNLKLYDMSFKLVASTNLKDDPRGIVAVSSNQVAVTIAREIRIFKIESKKIQSRPKIIGMLDKPFSIAFNKGFFAVETGEGEEGAIRIVPLSGGQQRFVIPGNTRSFGQFTGNTIRLEIDISKEVVYVVDVANNAIHCVGFKNRMEWTVKLNTPRGIALHGNTLFVASFAENKIYQLNATDGMVCSFLDDHQRVKLPRYITFNPEFNMLAAEMDSTYIRIYKIYRSSKTEVDI